MPEVANKAALQRAIENWNRGDLDAYLQIYSTGAVLHGYPGVEPGLESIKRFYHAFWSAFSDGRITIEDVVAEGEQVTCRFTFRGTHLGEFNGIPATGKGVAVPGITILRFMSGKCVERWSQTDFLGLMVQLGAIPGEGKQ